MLMVVASVGLLISRSQMEFLIISIGVFVLNSVAIILGQTIAGSLGRKIDHSLFMGLFNSIKSFGMIIGASLVGVIYSVQANFSFVFVAVNFLLASLLLMVFIISRKRGRV
jgi:MFS transporter, DHA1 family, multidrug resistance protein